MRLPLFFLLAVLRPGFAGAQDIGKLLVEAARGDPRDDGTAIREEAGRKGKEDQSAEKGSTGRSVEGRGRFTPRSTESRTGAGREVEARDTGASSRNKSSREDSSPSKMLPPGDSPQSRPSSSQAESPGLDTTGVIPGLSKTSVDSSSSSSSGYGSSRRREDKDRTTGEPAISASPSRTRGDEETTGQPDGSGATQNPGMISPLEGPQTSDRSGRRETATRDTSSRGVASREWTTNEAGAESGAISQRIKEAFPGLQTGSGSEFAPLHDLSETQFREMFGSSSNAAGKRGAIRGLAPLIEPTLEQGLGRARSREFALVVAVGITGSTGVPDAFAQSAVARASRLNLCLVSLDEAEAAESLRVSPEQFPAYVVLDSLGNVVAFHSPKVDTAALLASTRNAQAILRSIREEAPRILESARARVDTGDVEGLLAVARPWLKRRYRGNESIDQLMKLVATASRDRLAKALALPGEEALPQLEKLAADLEGTPLEGSVLIALARHYRTLGRNGQVGAVLKKITTTLPQAGNEDAIEEARSLLKDNRRELIQRRLEEMERQKKEAEQQHKK
jgi:hypothetical protein